jgi:hypothetical protein
LILFGCATPLPEQQSRRFNFETDTFAYENQLVWEYGYETNGTWHTAKRAPPPDYALHCFVVARSARQFFFSAVFDPLLPQLDSDGYARLIRRVVATNPRKPLPLEERIVIPGYSNLRTFSRAHESLLKKHCGAAVESYLQRGNWRTIFPFSRVDQTRQADRLAERVQTGWPPIVHIVDFPKLTINHAVVLFAVEQGCEQIRFSIYDPNEPRAPGVLLFDPHQRSFVLPPNRYFRGGKVNVYEVYHRWNY